MKRSELLKLAENAKYGMVYKKDAYGNWYIADCAEYSIEQLEEIFKVQDTDELRE